MSTGIVPTSEYLDQQHEHLRPAYRFNGHTSEDWLAWREQLLAALRDLWGTFEPGTPPAYSVLETSELDGYIRRKIVYEVRPGEPIPAWLLTPADVSEPVPGVLAIHGHGEYGKDAFAVPERSYHRTVAGVELARAGCVVLVPDHAGLGERRDDRGCELLYARINHLGEDVNAYRLRDLFAAMDLLCSLETVDSERCGNLGMSLGCWLAQLQGAFDERVKASVQSGRFSTFAQTIWDGRCICQHTRGIGAICEIPDIAGLMAPRPVAVEWGTEDTPRPVRPAIDLAWEIWNAAGDRDALTLFEFAGGHVFDGSRSIPWLLSILKG